MFIYPRYEIHFLKMKKRDHSKSCSATRVTRSPEHFPCVFTLNRLLNLVSNPSKFLCVAEGSERHFKP